MSKVYIVTRGEYSDYGIQAVFASRKEAEDLVAALEAGSAPHWDKHQIEEWDLGVPGFSPGLSLYSVIMDYEGNTIEHEKEDRLPNAANQTNMVSHGRFNKFPVMYTWMWARDLEHAVKIANERRTRMIAEGEWERLKMVEGS